MLILTPSGLETGAERAFFTELSSWDTGGSVRGALVAALALSDGPMDRRISDAVVLVPKGIAVVRVVEVVRQSGVVTVLPEGSWTIGPGAGPGDVLRLAGGGSTPLDGLMRAGMEVAVRLRRVGLEPGRIARLTVLHGDLHGLVPADGDLGEGDQVALLESRSLLLGIARASRYAGTDNPRLWTTADVRAALEALGVGGRSPAVEELNGEGFPYSPYVLRRRELIAPATLANQPAVRASGPTAGAHPGQLSPVPGHEPDGLAGAPRPLVDPSAAAALAAAAVAQQQASAEQSAPPLEEQRFEEQRAASGDTVALPGPDGPRTRAESPQATQQIRPVSPAPAPAPEPVLPPDGPDETGGIGGIFGGSRDGADADQHHDRYRAEPPAPAWGRSATSAPDRHSDGEGAAPAPERRRRRIVVAAAAVVLLLVVVGGVLVATGLGGSGDRGASAGPTSSATASASPSGPTTPPALPVGTVQQGGDTDYTLQVVSYDSTCEGHSYGAVTGFFSTTDCSGLSRSLWSADAGGQQAVVSLSRVTMPDPTRVQALLSLTDVSGTGNVSDLLREGSRYPGGPEKLSDAAYQSEPAGDVAVIVETSWVDQAGDPAALQQLADDALTLDPTG